MPRYRDALFVVVAGVLGTATAAQPPRRAATLAVTIGADDSRGDAYTFFEIHTVASAKDGRVFVLDRRDCVIKVFDTVGRHQLTFGGRGQGPGEFTQPGSMVVSDSDVVVLDGSARRARFSLAGKPIGTTVDSVARFAAPTYPLPHGFRLRVLEPLITRTKSGPTPSPYNTLTLERAASTRVDTIARIRGSALFFVGPAMFGALQTELGSGGAWALSGDTLLAVVDGYAGTATWYAFMDDGTRTVRSANLGQTAQPLTAAETAAIEAHFRWGDATKNPLAAPDVKFLEGPTHHSVATNAVFDNIGGLWISRGATASKSIVWTVFPVVGRAFAVELPAAFHLSTVRGDKLFGYAESAAGAPIVQVYALAR